LTTVGDIFIVGTSVAPCGDMSPPNVLTIGHSTRSIDEFIRLLAVHRVDRLVDIRTIPRSLHNPQFSRDLLSAALRRAGIRYTHMAGLGGLRHSRPGSVNGGWRNAGFRGYADYMQTAAFGNSLERCIDLASGEQIVLMCAEAVPWRCHRSLVADALLVRGIAVSEITSGIRTRPHSLTPWAEVKGVAITYPSAAASHESPPAKRARRRLSSRPRATAGRSKRL
jgi:uncharacterized protein (DUF488 family)